MIFFTKPNIYNLEFQLECFHEDFPKTKLAVTIAAFSAKGLVSVLMQDICR